MDVNIVSETPVSTSRRARQMSSMFDAPPAETCRMEWNLSLDLESQPWNVGLVVGPSGSGKSTVMRKVWGTPSPLIWGGVGVVDDFASHLSVQDIAEVCQAVGFNTIPAWMRPHAVLSNGEQFRVELARRLLEDGDPIVIDEFTSVVDRQVAQIGSHAVQKFCRRTGKRFVAVTCHYDVIDWLQPDWVLDMATCSFTRRCLQRRPALECTIGRLPRSAWSVFAPYHYLTGDLHRSAACYGLWVQGRLAAFAGLLHQPISNVEHGDPIWRVSRLVTLPDWQGLGLAFVLSDALGAEHVAAGRRLRTYPAHPALIRGFDRSPNWTLKRTPGHPGESNKRTARNASVGAMGGRPCAVFEYVGPAATERRLLQAS